MTTARICERWDMELPEVGGKPWFLDWVMRSPRQAGIHMTAGWRAYSALQGLDIRSAREYFGGVGAQALMIEEMFSPEYHVVLDRSLEAVAHLDRVMLRNVISAVEDSYDPRSLDAADLVGLDFGDLTAWKAFHDTPQAALLDRVFMLGPKAVVLTDIAARYLRLNREKYETLFGTGTCSDYPSYLETFTRLIEERYGYVLVAGFYHTWSTVMALVPVGVAERGFFEPTPDSPVGLKLVRSKGSVLSGSVVD